MRTHQGLLVERREIQRAAIGEPNLCCLFHLHAPNEPVATMARRVLPPASDGDHVGEPRRWARLSRIVTAQPTTFRRHERQADATGGNRHGLELAGTFVSHRNWRPRRARSRRLEDQVVDETGRDGHHAAESGGHYGHVGGDVRGVSTEPVAGVA